MLRRIICELQRDQNDTIMNKKVQIVAYEDDIVTIEKCNEAIH